MRFRHFLLAMIVAGTPLASAFQTNAAPTQNWDVVAGKDKPPRPTPKPGPRGGGDD